MNRFLNTMPVERRCPPCSGECEQGDACPARMEDDGLGVPRGMYHAAPLTLALWAAIAFVGALLTNPDALADVSAWLVAQL
jgi:hypothetical protein